MDQYEIERPRRTGAVAPDEMNPVVHEMRATHEMPSADGIGAVAVQEPTIGREQVQEAMEKLHRFKSGKANLDARVVANEQWFKLRHWELLRRESQKDEVEPSSAWLLNALLNKHADGMDNYPRPNVLPREAGDVEEAKKLSSILPVILDQIEFEKVYSDTLYPKLKHGTGIYGVFWDAQASSGLGEIAIKNVDILNLFWEPGITDIQDSSDVFLIRLYDDKMLEEMYPQLRDMLGGKNLTVSEYVHDDSIPTDRKSAVVDWYYKRRVNGKCVLHFCKFCGLEVLYSTENDPAMADKGLYDHGMYPFVFDVLFPSVGTPAGFGYIDIGKSPQEYIDRMSQAILENSLEGATPRYWASSTAGVNEEEFNDRKKRIVHYEGAIDSVQPMNTKPLASIYVNTMQLKIDELKEVTGNRDVSTGGTTSGVTAASAIAAMQEAGGKLSRDAGKGSYRAFRAVINLVIELIRQFYTDPHYFRVLGQDQTSPMGEQAPMDSAPEPEFIRYTNEGLVPQVSGMGMDGEPVYRMPVFDVEISAEKQSPYSRMAQNEMALQFYNAGFFSPQNAPSALACLDMMDFDRKDIITQKISQNGTLYQQLQQMQQVALTLAQQVDAMMGTQYTAQLASQIQMGGGVSMGAIDPRAVAKNADKETNVSTGEPSVTKNARERAAATTEV